MKKKLINLKLNRYGDSDYNCPYCGCPSSECKGNGNWGYFCRDCGEEFETPDT